MQARAPSASDCRYSGTSMSPDQSPNLAVTEKNPQSVAAQKALVLKNSRSKLKLSQTLLAANGQHQVEAAVADDLGSAQHTRERVPPARRPPSLVLRLLTKSEVLLIAG